MYVIKDLERVAAAQDAAEPCEECQQAVRRGRGGKEEPLLECEQCERGFHLSCLDPPLRSVPKVCIAWQLLDKPEPLAGSAALNRL